MACFLWLAPVFSLAATESAGERMLSVAIPAQPLPQALSSFSSAAHLQLVYVSQIALGKMTGGVSGGLPLTLSLQQLLAGTDLDFTFLNDRTVKLFEHAAPRQPAPASATGPAAAGPEAAAPLDEMIVSANKRREFLGSVPMSISVVSPDELAASGIQGIAGIAALAPGLQYDFSSQYGPGLLSNLAIRGISADKGDATTGVYVDDTPIQTPHTPFGNPYPVAFDLARIEVLRGPQGVLFGRGAEGGAIRFITNEPSTTAASEQYRAEVSATDGAGSSLELGAAAGGPLVDGVMGARLSAWYREDGGFVDRIDPLDGALVDADANRSTTRAVRLSLAYEPDDALRITPSFSHQGVNLHDTPVFFAAPAPLAGDPGEPLRNGKLLRQPAVDDLMLSSLTVNDSTAAGSLTGITSYLDRNAAATVDSTNAAGVDYFGGFGSPLGPEFPVSYADAVPTLSTLHQIQLSQELRMASSDDAPIQWQGGVFYSRLRQNLTRDTYPIATPSDPGILTDDYDVIAETSAFGDLRWSPDPYWNAGAGMRVGWLDAHGSSRAAGFAERGSAPFAQTSHQETLPPTPRLDLAYEPDGRNLFYAAIAKGLRAGGNAGAAIRCGSTETPTSFGPDSVVSFEVGAKNQLLDRRLHIDASVFDIHWNRIQESIEDLCGDTFTTNVGAAASRGFDLDVDALIGDGFNLKMALGFVDVRYTRELNAVDGQVIVARGAVVGGVPSVPAPWTGTLTARYQWPLGGSATAYADAAQIAHSHNPGPFTELEPKSLNYDPRLRADPAYQLLNLGLGVIRSGVNVRLFVDNATNSQPQLQRYADSAGSPLVYAYTFRPRTLGIRGNWAF